jgi:hypothetical protein
VERKTWAAEIREGNYRKWRERLARYILGGWVMNPTTRIPRTAFSLALCISAAAVLVLGLAPRSVLAFAERSILSLLT